MPCGVHTGRHMVFLFDSLCAAAILFSAILSWGMTENTRGHARIHLRFSAAMMASLSAVRLMPDSALALDLALLTPGLAAAASFLALAFSRRASIMVCGLIPAAGLAAGFLAVALDMPALALSYQTIMAMALIAWGLSRSAENPHAAIIAVLGAAALLFGAMAVMNRSLDAALLFFAAFMPLATRASEAAVADRRRLRSWLISGERA
jgi:hypothetical protein